MIRTSHAITLSTVAIGLLWSTSALAAGTALDVQSGRATGMASAMTAHVDDSSAIYFNAAGIAQGKTLDAQIGITPIIAGYRFTSTSNERTNLRFQIVPPVNAYVSGGITDNLSLGLGVNTPFGLSIKWPTHWQGRRLITQAANQNYYVNPTVAYRFGPIRVGAGFQLVRSVVELKKNIAFGAQEGSVDLGAATWGAGANFGMQYEILEKYLSFGAQYRSAVKLDFDGDAHFSNVPASLQSTLHDQRVSTSLINPDSFAFGLASRPIDRLVVDADVVWFGWSRFRSVNIRFPDDASGSLSSVEAKRWHNTLNFRVGAEGILTDHWRIRGGVLVDPSPSPASTLAPDVPDATRINLAAGGTYALSNGLYFDLGYQFLFLLNKTSTNPLLPGEYGGNVNILGVSIGYRMPDRDK